MKNGWTGGQYSLFRLFLAAYLFVQFATLLRSGPGFVRILVVLGALATLPLAVGTFDRVAAVLVWYLSASLLWHNPQIANPSILSVGWVLLAHALVPKAPYGSWQAKGRADPRGDWAMPEPLFLAAWIAISLAYTYNGASKLVSPAWVGGTALSLELFYAPLALSRKLRPWIWLGMLGVHLGLFILVDFADLSRGLLPFHLFTFDPGWIPARKARVTETLFYDGHCALCHGAVRFVLAEDRSPDGIRFAPLQGEGVKEQIPEARRAGLPDSLVVLTADGIVMTRSAAVLHLLAGIGGLWRLFAGIARVVPAGIRDAAYDGVARFRYRVFGKRTDLCPIIPAKFRPRFDLR
jgi:predicted DCC family thiol-disulfide oxidoreductase YuxK